jgi:hypothetical protein
MNKKHETSMTTETHQEALLKFLDENWRWLCNAQRPVWSDFMVVDAVNNYIKFGQFVGTMGTEWDYEYKITLDTEEKQFKLFYFDDHQYVDADNYDLSYKYAFDLLTTDFRFVGLIIQNRELLESKSEGTHIVHFGPWLRNWSNILESKRQYTLEVDSWSMITRYEIVGYNFMYDDALKTLERCVTHNAHMGGSFHVY